MAEQTTSSVVIDAPPSTVMEVIADFPAYPEWAQGIKHVEVIDVGDNGRADRVHFELEASPIRDSYVLEYTWQDDSQVTWHLLDGKMLKAMQGAYILRAVGNGTEVTYRLAVDVAIPMIGMLKRRAEKVIIDSALKGLKKRVESLH